MTCVLQKYIFEHNSKSFSVFSKVIHTDTGHMCRVAYLSKLHLHTEGERDLHKMDWIPEDMDLMGILITRPEFVHCMEEIGDLLKI